MDLRIEKTSIRAMIPNKYGITNGKKWFAFAYHQRVTAEKVLNRIKDHPNLFNHNINRAEPLCMGTDIGNG